MLSCSALRSLRVALHPSACGLSNVHCWVHYEVDATAQATGIRDRNMAVYTLLSGHAWSAAYLLPIYTYNYPECVANEYKPGAHFAAKHELRVKDSTSSCYHNVLQAWAQTLCLLLWPLFAF